MTPEQQAAFDEYERSVKEFTDREAETYVPEWMPESLYGQIATDPRYKDAELSALRALEEQASQGLTARDVASMAETRREVDRANRGRIGAIQQSMQSRGIAGSGLDLVAQLQSAQDANEVAAMRALETDALASDRRSEGSAKLGALSSSLQNRDFQQQAARAQAQDNINRFNNENRNEGQRFNISNRQAKNTANFQAKSGLADRRFDVYTDNYNREQAEKEAKRRRKSGAFGGVLGAIGGVAGGILGSAAGPLGAAAGASIGAGAGSSLGQAFGGYAEGGKIPGAAPYPGDDPRNDILTANVSPGEVIIPRSMANDPAAAAAYVAGLNSAGPKQSFYDGGMVEPGQIDARDLRLFEPNPIYGPKGKDEKYDAFASIKNPFVRDYMKKKLQGETEELSSQEDSSQFNLGEFMKKNRENYDTAKNQQAYLNIADTFGRVATDYLNSQTPEVIYSNRLADLGKVSPTSRAKDMQWTDLSPLAQNLANESRRNIETGLKYAYKRNYEQKEQEIAARADEQKNSTEERIAAKRKARQNEIDGRVAKAATEKAPKPLSAEAGLKLANFKNALQAVDDMEAALNSGNNTFTLFGDNNYTLAQDKFAEGYGRGSSGASITKEEREAFKDRTPGITNSRDEQLSKLRELRKDILVKMNGLDPSQAAVATPSQAEQISKSKKPTWAK